MGKQVDLGKSVRHNEVESKEHLHLYMNIPTTINLMIKIHNTPDCSKYIESFTISIKAALSLKEIRKVILNLYGFKTVKKFIIAMPKESEILIAIFGKGIFGEKI
jgi:hypothetical protein